MDRFELVIAGGGLTAARAIKSYREAGGGGRIALVAEEPTLPYHRPALSKRFLRGETTETPFVEDESFYTDNDVEVLLETAVSSVDTDERVVTADGRRLGYGKLLLATGARARRLPLPGAELDGVFTLRRVDDSAAIRAAAGTARSALVIGGGFIGMEVAASLRKLGLAVTLIHLGSGLFDQLGSRRLSDELLALYEENEVGVLLEEEVAGFGGDERLEYVEAKSGVCVEADLAVVGAGVVPNVEFLDGSRIALGNGVIVDEHFATSAPGVYAAGDVANFFDRLYGRQRRLEHWSNADYQGAQAGKVLAGAEAEYEAVSSFFSEVFGTTIKVFGEVGSSGVLTVDGSLAAERFLAGYGDRGRLVGAVAVGQDEAVERRIMQLIAEGSPVTALPSAELAVSSI